MRTVPIAAIEVLLRLPLHLKIESEARVGIYRLRCNEQWGPKSLWYGHTSISRDMIKEPILQMGTDKIMPRYAFHKPFTVKLTNRIEWDRGLVPIRQWGLIWYTDGSKTNEGTGAGLYGHGMRRKFSFNLGRYTTVYAIKTCADENIKRNNRNRNMYILSDSQAAIKALNSSKIYSRMVWECHQSLMTLAASNKAYLMWVPGHTGIHGYETADQLAKMGSLRPFIGPEPAFGISDNVARRAIRDWVSREHHKYWQSILGQRHTKGFRKKNRRALDAQQVPNTTGDRTTNKTLSRKGTPLQVGEGKQPQL
jgi:ribonuclease HI